MRDFHSSRVTACAPRRSSRFPRARPRSTRDPLPRSGASVFQFHDSIAPRCASDATTRIGSEYSGENAPLSTSCARCFRVVARRRMIARTVTPVSPDRPRADRRCRFVSFRRKGPPPMRTIRDSSRNSNATRTRSYRRARRGDTRDTRRASTARPFPTRLPTRCYTRDRARAARGRFVVENSKLCARQLETYECSGCAPRATVERGTRRRGATRAPTASSECALSPARRRCRPQFRG